MQSTPLTCVRTHCRSSLVQTTVLHSYMRRVCRHYRWLHSYVLLVCRQHRRPAFIRVAKPRCYPLLSYIGTCCWSADYIVDLCSYALENLVGMHGCPTFVHAARLPPLPLATFVHTPRLPSTSSTCVRTHCRTWLVHTTVVHSYTLQICPHYRWLHSYVLLVCHQRRQPAFVRVAEPRWYTPLSYIGTRCTSAAITAGYIRTCCSSAVNIVDLRSYALQNLVSTHCCPTFVGAAHLPSTSSTYVRTRCRTSLVHTTVLHSYMLHVCHHYRGYIRMCCSSAVNIVDLRSYALQNLVATHCCPTFVRAVRLPTTSSTCVRTRCRTSSVRTAVLHWYMLRVCRHYRWLDSYVLLVCRQHCRPAFVHVAEPRWYTPLSYIRTRCTSATINAGYLRTCCSSVVYIVDLRSYTLQKFVGTHCSPTFVRAARMQSTPLTCVCTRCRTSLVHTAVLHSYSRHVCHHYRWLHSYALLGCR